MADYDAKVGQEFSLPPSLLNFTSDVQQRIHPHLPLWTRPTGCYGVTLLRASYSDPVLLKGTSKNHLIGGMYLQPVLTQHMMAGEHLEHLTGPGSVCIRPAGVDYSVEFLGPVSGIVLEVNTECFAMVQAQSGSYGTLSSEALQRLNRYVAEHMAEPFDVADMASVAGCERFRFARALAKASA